MNVLDNDEKITDYINLISKICKSYKKELLMLSTKHETTYVDFTNLLSTIQQKLLCAIPNLTIKVMNDNYGYFKIMDIGIYIAINVSIYNFSNKNIILVGSFNRIAITDIANVIIIGRCNKFISNHKKFTIRGRKPDKIKVVNKFKSHIKSNLNKISITQDSSLPSLTTPLPSAPPMYTTSQLPLTLPPLPSAPPIDLITPTTTLYDGKKDNSIYDEFGFWVNGTEDEKLLKEYIIKEMPTANTIGYSDDYTKYHPVTIRNKKQDDTLYSSIIPKQPTYSSDHMPTYSLTHKPQYKFTDIKTKLQ
jgi:hypothetical protein